MLFLSNQKRISQLKSFQMSPSMRRQTLMGKKATKKQERASNRQKALKMLRLSIKGKPKMRNRGIGEETSVNATTLNQICRCLRERRSQLYKYCGTQNCPHR